MRIARKDNSVADLVLIQMVKDSVAVGAVAVPGVEIDYGLVRRLYRCAKRMSRTYMRRTRSAGWRRSVGFGVVRTNDKSER